jgi:hypothetical protein
MKAEEIKFRCSSLGHLMAEGNRITEKQLARIVELQSKEKRTQLQSEELNTLIYKRDNPELSEGVKTHLVDIFVSAKYNRFSEISAKQLDKGNDTEEDSITIVSCITGKLFKKNEECLENDFIKGTPDLFTGKNIAEAETIRDTKSSWDAYTFFRAKNKPLNSLYYWQGTGYMALTKAKRCSIDYCLNNTPYHILRSLLLKEAYSHEERTPAWIELQIIANHTYDKKTFDEYIERHEVKIEDRNAEAVYKGFVEIPLKERHFNFEFDRKQSEIDRLYARIKECRDYMDEHLFKTELIETF